MELLILTLVLSVVAVAAQLSDVLGPQPGTTTGA